MTNLDSRHFLFGGKGDVFNKTAHIALKGFSPNTLCGNPMLSTNWVRNKGVTEAGCPKCIKLYEEYEKAVQAEDEAEHAFFQSHPELNP